MWNKPLRIVVDQIRSRASIDQEEALLPWGYQCRPADRETNKQPKMSNDRAEWVDITFCHVTVVCGVAVSQLIVADAPRDSLSACFLNGSVKVIHCKMGNIESNSRYNDRIDTSIIRIRIVDD
uniref:Uncharacterized protein n=1 Tax=Pristionchus pacificus TaxID=54126 RepID=A0A2A6CAK2_PRIPA|eukprot:PDM75051.1 hypothetical protein PRIPAC_40432 [Pristionchus pacificus]